nr:MAG TPA: hypothetical protein [Caudoviricetes sp.]
MIADIIFTAYIVLLAGYVYVTYSKKYDDLRFNLWKRGIWL